jgi:hypothetical protein
MSDALPLALRLLSVTALIAATSGQGPPTFTEARPETRNPFDLRAAMRASDVAEIYLVGRHIMYPAGPRPDIVRRSGCKYQLYRESWEWRELEDAMNQVDVDIAPTTQVSDVRVALILGDRYGIRWEIYTRYPDPGERRVPGFSQGRPVTIAADFVSALEIFTYRHPDLITEGSRRDLCTTARRNR